MTVILITIFFACCAGVQFCHTNEYYHDYISPEKTAAIKAIFVLLVFFRHYSGYITLNGPFDQFFVWLDSHSSQLIVTMFLFYSGYGVMESIRKKGASYVKQLPAPRALKTLLHFDIAVIFFLLLNWVLGNEVSLQKFLLSLVCWESIGNSNWYIFAIVATYLLTFVAFSIARNHHYAGAALTTVLCAALIWILIPFRPAYCYNTIPCYLLGMWYSLLRKPLEKLIAKNDLSWLISIFSLLLVYFFSYFRCFDSLPSYFIWTFAFTLLIVCLSMKISLGNPFLSFLNDHVFSIYILQRLPLWYLARTFDCSKHPIAYFLLSFLATMILALIFDHFTGKLDRLLFSHPVKSTESAV